jgi:dolichol-phosphate mannosyltransferase
MKTYIVIPTYNEAENIRPMASALLKLGIPSIHILFVDDNSPDGTGDIAEMLKKEYPGRIDVLHRAGKEGLGKAYVAGFQYALSQGADIIVQMDCDFSHDPKHIPEMIANLQWYDLVVGSRYMKNSGLDEDWPLARKLLSTWANSIYNRLILRTKLTDSTGGFKAWRRTTLEGIGLERVQSNGYIFQAEMSYMTERLGYRIKEIPIYFAERVAGESKMDFGIQIEAALRVWQIWWRHRKLRKSDRYPESVPSFAWSDIALELR